MSRTFSSCARERSANGYAPRTSSCSSSTSISSSAQIATICCASTSSGLRGMTVSSMSPSRIRAATTADSSRSARNFGKMRPFETAPSSWPARPMRCSPRATDFGDSTWTTRSTAPMSMPSSSDEVATRHGISPAFKSSSTSSRCSRASEPLQALDGQCEVRAALRACDGMDLVEDQRLDAAQRLARARREEQEERLGRRDEDVRRLAEHRGALALRRVAGADGDAELALEPGERTAQVALDVVVQRLERGDVEEADA